MKKLIIFILSVLVLSSCVTVREPQPTTPCCKQKRLKNHPPRPYPHKHWFWHKKHH